MATTGRQLRSTLGADGALTLELVEQQFPDPVGNQVLVRMEAAPINPSDLFLLTAGADLANAQYSAGKVVAQLHPVAAAAQKARAGQSLPVMCSLRASPVPSASQNRSGYMAASVAAACAMIAG